MNHPAIEKLCEQCKKPFRTKKYHVDRGHGRFCSMKCTRLAIFGESSTRAKFFKFTHIPEDPNECWIWGSVINNSGYGQLNFKYKIILAHRLSWELHNGPIPKGMMVCHKCDSRYPVISIEYRKCVNPSHLFVSDALGNIRDAVSKGRNSRGERRYSAKLTEDDVRQVRQMRSNGMRQQDVADHFGVSKSCINLIDIGKNWRHVA